MASLARRAAALVLAGVAIAGCDTGDGRTLDPPAEGATAPPLPAETTQATPAPVFAASSEAFVDGGAIPARYTCHGEDITPPIGWGAVPDGTVEFAIVMRDLDLDGAVHWLMASIPPDVIGFGEVAAAEGAVEVVNAFGTRGWTGPCPPAGEIHRYEFTVHALGTPSGVTPDDDVAGAVAAVEAATIASTSITGTYAVP